jgi:hypothetical protein
MSPYTERLAESEYPLARAAALLGLYTFFVTQPSTSAPPLHALAHLPMTIGELLLCSEIGQLTGSQTCISLY